MKRSVRPSAPPEWSVDPLDACTGFGAFGGVLSVVLPYFDGLVAALAAMALGVTVGGRLGSLGADGGEVHRRRIYVGLLGTGVGWGFFLVAPRGFAVFRGLVLGGSIALLWWGARRRLPFGGL